MSTLNELREGSIRAWKTVTEGWCELVERPDDVLTRFHSKHSGGDVETREERSAQHGARWRMLAAEAKGDDARVEGDIEVPGGEADDFEIRVGTRCW